MRSIFEFNEILQQDAHEDEQQTVLSILPTMQIERQRTYSDSSITSIDGDDNIFTMRSKKGNSKTCLEMISLSTLLTNNEPQPFFSNDVELYGTNLVNPLLVFSSTLST
jgi:hypothetical protein